MKPIVFDLPNEQYHHSADTASYISSSQLKDYAVSPAYAKYMREHPELREETPSMRLGTMFHNLMERIVNGETIDEAIEHYAVFYPAINPKTLQPYGETTNKYQEGYQQFLAENDGKTIISEKNLETIKGMATAVLSLEENRKMIQYARPQEDHLKGAEISFFSELADGVYGKCRCDALSSSKCIDWKSCSCELTPDALSKQIINFGYDVSCAMYQHILYKVTGQFYSFYWVFTSNKAPFLSTPPVCADNWGFASEDEIIAFDSDLNNDMLFNRGVMVYRALLNEHIKCVQNNQWPGPEAFVNVEEGNPKIMTVDCPAWALNQIPKFYN